MGAGAFWKEHVMHSLKLILGLAIALLVAAPARAVLEYKTDPPVDLGGGLMQFTFSIRSDSPFNTITVLDPGAVPTPVMCHQPDGLFNYFLLPPFITEPSALDVWDATDTGILSEALGDGQFDAIADPSNLNAVLFKKGTTWAADTWLPLAQLVVPLDSPVYYDVAVAGGDPAAVTGSISGVFNPVPEPGVISLFCLSAAAFGFCGWRRRRGHAKVGSEVKDDS